MSAFLAPAIPAQARRDLWYPFFERYKRVVFLSAPCHLTTIASCLLNWASSSSGEMSAWWWLACAAFVVGHGYPVFSTGIRLMGLTKGEWDGLTLEEGKRWLGEFVDVNGTRLVLVDLPGWVCVVVTVVGGLR